MLTRRDGLRLTLGLAATLAGGSRPGFVSMPARPNPCSRFRRSVMDTTRSSLTSTPQP